ncbi:helix-turn-helix domain-containing protein [Vibrio sp. WXL210]|uniref:helix-turn-helix domain-containing protein n=1 Tax=Vibrio sp. WXL210 TaxID=3450709 RepID=UPI003EC72557
MTFIDSKKLKSERTAKNYTQETLATISGVDTRTIGRIERGETGGSLETLMSLCTALALQREQLSPDIQQTLVSPEAIKLLKQSIDATEYAGDIVVYDHFDHFQVDVGTSPVINVISGKDRANARAIIEELISNDLITLAGGQIYSVTSKGYALVE